MSVPTSAGTTGTYTFSPSAADIVQNAFRKIQIWGEDIHAPHLADATMESNLLAIDISNRNPNMWQRELVTQVLTASDCDYTLNARTVLISTATLSTTDGSGTVTERILTPIAADAYASYPVKLTEGTPSSYWFSLANPPVIYLYPTPDDADTYTLNMWTFRQSMDVDLASGYSPDAPYRFLDAFATGLAARLAQIYRPEQADKLEAQFEARFKRAAAMDQESAALSISPGLTAYYRI